MRKRSFVRAFLFGFSLCSRCPCPSDYFGTVEALLPHFGSWQPNYICNDREREKRRFALVHRTLDTLKFEEAVIVHDRSGVAAIEIHLRSSARLLWVELRCDGGKLEVQTRLDCSRAVA